MFFTGAQVDFAHIYQPNNEAGQDSCCYYDSVNISLHSTQKVLRLYIPSDITSLINTCIDTGSVCFIFYVVSYKLVLSQNVLPIYCTNIKIQFRNSVIYIYLSNG